MQAKGTNKITTDKYSRRQQRFIRDDHLLSGYIYKEKNFWQKQNEEVAIKILTLKNKIPKTSFMIVRQWPPLSLTTPTAASCQGR